MKIYVNGEARTVDDGFTAGALLENFGFAGRRVAVEVNREIVPRSEHTGFRLSEGDRVEVVQAIGGG